MALIPLTAAFTLGAIVGSFLNVCIYRLPRGESVIAPRSRCTQCGMSLRARDNVPIIAWLALKGRCRTCGTHVSARYPLVETLSGTLAVIAVMKFGPTWTAAAAYVFAALLMVVVFTDLDFQIIPDEINAAAFIAGAASIGVLPVTLWDAIAGAAIGVGILGGLAYGYHKLTGREGMGGGDVKLAAVLGIVLGASGLVVTLFLASLAGTLVGLAMLTAQRKSLRTPLPFGCFLAPAAVIVLLLGPDTFTHAILRGTGAG